MDIFLKNCSFIRGELGISKPGIIIPLFATCIVYEVPSSVGIAKIEYPFCLEVTKQNLQSGEPGQVIIVCLSPDKGTLTPTKVTLSDPGFPRHWIENGTWFFFSF